VRIAKRKREPIRIRMVEPECDIAGDATSQPVTLVSRLLIDLGERMGKFAERIAYQLAEDVVLRLEVRKQRRLRYAHPFGNQGC